MNKLNKIIEISKMNEVTGRSSIKIALHEIYESSDTYNKNGISWNETYTENNIGSCIGMPICVSFLDDTNTIPSGHGDFQVLDDGTVTFGNSSVVVGAIEKAYVSTVEINGVDKKVLLAEGYLFSQRFNNFVEWLKDTMNLEQITTSIEIGAKSPNVEIAYDGGYKEKGRIPQDYCYTATAILYIVEAADDSAVVLEVNQLNSLNKDLNSSNEDKNNISNSTININSNNKNVESEVKQKLTKKKKVIKGQTFEMNALNYYDISSIITKAFNKLMCPTCSDWCYDFSIHRFYPTESYVIMQKYDEVGEYWKVQYTITNGDITLGDISEVEEDWKPCIDVEEIIIDISSLKEDFNNKNETESNVCKGKQENNSDDKGGNTKMDEKQLLEINAKLDELTSKSNESDSKIAELNSIIVEANKALELKATELNALAEENKTLLQFKAEKDLDAKKSEINSYFVNEVSKNGFSEVELNSLKAEYVEKMDLNGLKLAEAELCVKKVKELNSVQKSLEVNSTNDNTDLFMAIRNTEKSEEDISDLY